MTSKESFRTSFGRQIPLMKGYADLHKKSSRHEILYQPSRESDEQQNIGGPLQRSLRYARREGFSALLKRLGQRLFYAELPSAGYLKDRFEYSIVMDYLHRIGVEGPWDRMLDIGSAEGYIPRFYRGESLATHVTACDICKPTLDNASFDKLMTEWNRGFNALKRRKRIDLLLTLPDMFSYHPPTDSAYWNITSSGPFSLDEFLLKNMMDVDGKYDLVTGYLCIEHFPLRKFFEKVFSILNSNGIFCFLVNYWWWPVNSTAIVGHFPYAAQRLTREDLERYAHDFHPDSADDIMTRYDYFHEGDHPTVNDYLEIGRQVGLAPIGYVRLMPQAEKRPKTKMSPRVLRHLTDFSFDEVLADIHCFRSDVQQIDLETAFVVGVFKKEANANEHSSAYIKRAMQTTEYTILGD